MVSVGSQVPTAGPLTEDKPDNEITLPTSGKILIGTSMTPAFDPNLRQRTDCRL